MDDELKAFLIGGTEPSDCLGSCADETVRTLIETDGEFRDMLFSAVERCVADSERESMVNALNPLLAYDGITVPVLSRFLAIAAPDRFMSIQDKEARLRLSDMVGFDAFRHVVAWLDRGMARPAVQRGMAVHTP